MTNLRRINGEMKVYDAKDQGNIKAIEKVTTAEKGCFKNWCPSHLFGQPFLQSSKWNKRNSNWI